MMKTIARIWQGLLSLVIVAVALFMILLVFFRPEELKQQLHVFIIFVNSLNLSDVVSSVISLGPSLLWMLFIFGLAVSVIGYAYLKKTRESERLFCLHCGDKLVRLYDSWYRNNCHRVIKERRCIHCGAKVIVDAHFCPECGKEQK